MDKTWTNIGQKLDKTCTFVKKLSKFCPTPHSTGAPENEVIKLDQPIPPNLKITPCSMMYMDSPIT